MTMYLLDRFLNLLAADGLRLTSRDYERVGLVLQTGGQWTIARLRDTLMALLAKDQDQQEIFLRHFEEFFGPLPDAPDQIAQLDIQRVLADLRALAPARPPAPPDALKPQNRPRLPLPTIAKRIDPPSHWWLLVAIEDLQSGRGF
jgi:hypothetical protein